MAEDASQTIPIAGYSSGIMWSHIAPPGPVHARKCPNP
jgi:hypothetical protein